MTVHAIRILCATEQADNPDRVPSPAPPSFPDVIPERVNQHVLGPFSEVATGERQAARLADPPASPDVPAHVRGLYRFASDENRTVLLDAIEADVVADATWYRLDVHDCEHDQPIAERSGCPSWTVGGREFGPVPNGV